MKFSALMLFAFALAACGGTPATSDAYVADAAFVPDVGAAVDSARATDTGPRDDAAVDPCTPRTIVVTTPGFSYSFDGGPPDGTLTLCAGVTYMFDLTAVPAVHPMQFRMGSTSLADFAPGMTSSYTVPTSGAMPDAYVCTVHLFGGVISVR